MAVKNNKDRVCFLNIISQRYLEIYIEKVRPMYLAKGVESKYLFPAKSGVRQFKKWISERIWRWRDIANIDFPVTAHAFRRSFATHLLQEGVGVRYIQQMMGHDSIDSTLQYIKLNIDDLRNALIRFHPREKLLADKEIVFKG
jgi:integrase/recombinase XerD